MFLIGDGMGDFPCAELGGRTPLQAAAMTRTRRLAAAGQVVMMRTAPPGWYPGSDVCNLGLLGYNPAENYTGRAPIEAAGGGVPMRGDDVAFRCNLVTVRDGIMIDHSAGHITDAEAAELMAAVAAELGGAERVFHTGVSYRHLLLWANGPDAARTEAPHEILDRPVAGHLPRGEGADALKELMEASRAVLADHPVNRRRLEADPPLNPANQIWLWGQGRALALQPYAARYQLGGGVVTAVDLVRGLGVLAGLETPRVEGATGFVDTNYAGKVAAGLEVLERHDFAYIHIEAPDECGHLGDAERKTAAISDFDAQVVGPVWDALEAAGQPYRLVVTMDHRTPCALRGHSDDPVPLAWIDGPVGPVDGEAPFDEFVDGGDAETTSWEWVDAVLRP